MDISEFLTASRSLIEQRLDLLIPEQNVSYGQLFKAARYAILNTGKKLRPLLTLATAETLGIAQEKVLNAACAIEMIHTYSLIHDDLPCMDDDDYRRGKLTVHKAFGEGQAVLTGDYLLTYAFEVIAEDPELTLKQKVLLTSLLAKGAGSKGMIAGQLMDIQAEGVSIEIDTLHQIHQFKTGAMITTAIEFGAVVANATEQQHQILRNYGNAIGLAFQIIDDVLDVSASIEKHGKVIASDQINNKTTYVTLLGTEAAQEKALILLDRAMEQLNLLDCDTVLLQELAKKLVCRNI